MQFLLMILFLICFLISSVHSLYAQSSDTPDTPEESKKNILLLDNSDSIFPKSKTNFSINSTFKGNTFQVKKVFKQNKNVGFNPSAMQGGGMNSQFTTPRKPIDEKTIPQELKDILKRSKKE